MLGRYAVLSLALHVLIVVAALFGVLNYHTDVVDISSPISVELIYPLEDVSKTPEIQPEPHNPDHDKPTPALPPQTHEPSPPSQPDPVVEPLPQDVHIPHKSHDVTPEPKKAIIAPPKPKPKPPRATPKPKPRKSNSSNDFDALLKNLTNRQTGSKTPQSHTLSDHLAASELDAVRKQIESVWRVPGGVEGIHNVTVSLTISMNPDRTVRHAVVKSSPHAENPTFIVLTESALRAVNEFKVKPLKLPPQRYKVWKEINMKFDPKDLL